MCKVFADKVWTAVEPLPVDPFNEPPIRLAHDESQFRKPFEQLTQKRQRQRLRDGVSAASAASGLAFPTFAAQALLLEEHRRRVPAVLAALPVDITRPWALQQLHSVAFSAGEVAGLKDSACLSEYQVRGRCVVMLLAFSDASAVFVHGLGELVSLIRRRPPLPFVFYSCVSSLD